MQCINMGHRNAAVLPEPVFAMPITSRPLRAAGIACSELRVKYITVGGVIPELELMLAVKTLTCE